MNKDELNINDFDLDEIESIELMGEEETIDITVEDTHMFYANGIYTHNSGISSEVVTNDQMQGSIKRAQIAHLIITAAKTLEQKEAGLATMAITKSRFGKDGIIFRDMTFNNALMLFDTEENNIVTQLGYEENKKSAAEKNQQNNAIKAYNMIQQQKNMNTNKPSDIIIYPENTANNEKSQDDDDYELPF